MRIRCYPTMKDKLNIKHENIKPFWTSREYEYQNLIINDFTVQREVKISKVSPPKARVNIHYDTGEGAGAKKINGYEKDVFKEACKFLTFGERDELNKKWVQAKFLDAYDGREIEKSADPIKDLFLTQDIDPKDVVKEKKGLSTLYKHIKGDLELTKKKALEYGSTINIAPQTLMFDPMRIVVWGNVNLTNDLIKKDALVLPAKDGKPKTEIPMLIHPGRIYTTEQFETAIVPTELYRLDIKAIQIKSKKSIYDNFVAYYYETNEVSKEANNRLCLIREDLKERDPILSRFDKYVYYLGIYQIYGTKKRILNPDPTSDNKIIKDNIEPDLVAPIISFTKPESLEADKIVTKNFVDAQKLGKLIREEEAHRSKITVLKNETINALLEAKKTSAKISKTHKITTAIQKEARDILDQAKGGRKETERIVTKARKTIEDMEKKQKLIVEALNDARQKVKLQSEKKSFLTSLFTPHIPPSQYTEASEPLYEKDSTGIEKLSGLPIEDIKLTKGDIADIDRVFAQGDKLDPVDIDRLIFQYRGSMYLQEKLKHDPAMLKLIPEGLDMDASFEETRIETRIEKNKKKKIIAEDYEYKDYEDKIA